MSYCPKCNEDFDSDLSACPKCKIDLDDEPDVPSDVASDGWVVIGHVKDQTTADYAKETLESYDIPAVLFSESGFFGQAGLNLPSPSGKHIGTFKIQVPVELIDDAVNILNMILGDSWENAIGTDSNINTDEE